MEKNTLDQMKVTVHVKAGEHLVQAYFAQKTTTIIEDLFDPSLRREPYRQTGGLPKLEFRADHRPVERDGGHGRYGEPPPRAVCALRHRPPTRRAPSASSRRSRAARIGVPSPTPKSQVPLARYRDGAKDGGFESGIEMALRSILVSPKFLFRFESQPATVAPNTAYRISDIDLASRLSFFLWSSIPDDELLDLAEKRTLHRPDVLQQQVRRMLADPRSQALVDNFAGQWLHIRNVPTHQPSPETLFHFDDNLRKAFEQETKLFFESIMRENRSVLDLLDADYTFLNERLAKHYGIRGVHGERFRRVSLPADSPRRGLLGTGRRF